FFSVLGIVGQLTRGGEQGVEFCPLLHAVEGRVGVPQLGEGIKERQGRVTLGAHQCHQVGDFFHAKSLRAPVHSKAGHSELRVAGWHGISTVSPPEPVNVSSPLTENSSPTTVKSSSAGVGAAADLFTAAGESAWPIP